MKATHLLLSLALLIGDGPGIAPWIATGDEVNSVEHPVLEFFSLADTVGPVDQRIAANLAALDGIRERGLTDVRIDGAKADALARAKRDGGKPRVLHPPNAAKKNPELHPEDRIRDQQLDGVVAEAIYGSTGFFD